MRYKITGRVQGVGFRYFTRRTAQDLGLRGWVRNCVDGSVEAVAVGTASQLEAFEQAVRKGPSMARVEAVESSEASPEGLYETFEIVT